MVTIIIVLMILAQFMRSSAPKRTLNPTLTWWAVIHRVSQRSWWILSGGPTENARMFRAAFIARKSIMAVDCTNTTFRLTFRIMILRVKDEYSAWLQWRKIEHTVREKMTVSTRAISLDEINVEKLRQQEASSKQTIVSWKEKFARNWYIYADLSEYLVMQILVWKLFGKISLFQFVICLLI